MSAQSKIDGYKDACLNINEQFLTMERIYERDYAHGYMSDKQRETLMARILWERDRDLLLAFIEWGMEG